MHKLFSSVGLFLFAIIQVVLLSQSAHAASSELVIYQLQTQGSGSTASAEYVSVKNNGLIDIDVTNWCVVYSSSSDVTQTNLKCLTPPDINTRLWLPAGGYFSFSSNEFLTLNPSYIGDGVFSAGIAASSGHIKLLDSDKNLVDKLGWGSAVSSEAIAKTAHTAGNILQRNGVDTDNNAADFVQTTLTSIPASGIYEEVLPVDECPNTPDLDLTIPIGYMKDGDGNCFEDICDNMSDLQKTLPIGYYQEGIDCRLIEIKINEVLANADGSDTGMEFIEIYNPTSHDVDLGGYYVQLGPGFTKNYVLPSTNLVAGGYASLSDSQTGITLPNTTGSLRLFTPDGVVVDETDSYTDPEEGESWAYIDGGWQYTNVTSPGNLNKESTTGGKGSGVVASVKPCPVGKYRNPDTNRCRKIVVAESLKPCGINKVRNPETNRCRSIFTTTSGLTPCKAGQIRNPETNRCRKAMATTSNLKPCSPNQERNPETNRCRKKSASALAASEVKDVESKIMADHNGWLLAGSASIGLAGYGIAEWRSEITLGARRFLALLGKNPPTD